jgi:hypothetical protein
VAGAGGPPGAADTSGPQLLNRRIGCDEVIDALDNDKKLRHGGQVTVIALARALRVRPEWVERCLSAYGRNVPKGGQAVSAEVLPEDRLERLEEGEAEEMSPEEIEEPGEQKEFKEKPIKTPRPTPRSAQ